MLGLLAFRCGEVIGLRSILCTIVSLVYVTLVVSLFVWRLVSDSLNHLSDRYFAMRHVINIARHMRDANSCVFCTLLHFGVTGVMGDRHGHLSRRHGSDLVFYKVSLVPTVHTFVCSLIVASR